MSEQEELYRLRLRWRRLRLHQSESARDVLQDEVLSLRAERERMLAYIETLKAERGGDA